LIVVYDYIIL